MQILFPIFFLFLVSCATKSEIRDNLPKEDRNATLRIEFENSQNNNSILHIYLCKDLPKDELTTLEKCEFKLTANLNVKEEVIYDLPAGEYFAKLELSDKKILLPLIVSEWTNINIKFGYSTKSNDFLVRDTLPKINNISHCQKGTFNKYECPKLILKENIRTTFKFQINKEYEFDEDGTFFIWLGTVVISIQVRFPIPLPIFFGFFAIKRDIKHNLK